MEDLSIYNPEGSTLRKVQLRMLDILVEVDKIFRKHGIEYAIEGGTCLGAVRHGGFIPWDDDLDIAVKYSDMPKIKDVLQKELPNNLAYQDMSTDPNYHLKLAKVRDLESLFDDPYSRRFKLRGIYIDIIPWENVVPFKVKNFVDFVYIRCIRGTRNYSDVWYEKVLGYMLYPAALLMVALCRLWRKIFPNNEWGHTYGWISYRHLDKGCLFPAQDIIFEGRKVLGPNNSHLFLTGLFGDYMQIPPKEKRETHALNITFFK